MTGTLPPEYHDIRRWPGSTLSDEMILWLGHSFIVHDERTDELLVHTGDGTARVPSGWYFMKTTPATVLVLSPAAHRIWADLIRRACDTTCDHHD